MKKNRSRFYEGFMKYLCFILLIFILPGCMVTYPVPLKQEQDDSNIVKPSSLKQTDNKSCALACIYYVSRYWGIQKDMATIEQEIGEIPKNGYTLRQLCIWVRDNNLKAYVISGKFEDLKYHTEKKRPLIVILKKDKNRHSVVVKRITQQDEILALDPSVGSLVKIEKETFLKLWEPLHNPMLIIAPPIS